MDSLLSTLAPLTSAAPYHLLAYGTLLGTELYQVCRSFSVYLTIQKLTVLKRVLSWHQSAIKPFLCRPLPHCRSEFFLHISGFKIFSFFSPRLLTLPMDRILSSKIRREILLPWSSLVPWRCWILPCSAPGLRRPWLGEFIKVSAVCSLPWNTHGTNCITETKDGKKFNDPELSDEMRVKNKAFSHNHAMSIHLNLLAVGATLWYGLRLASKIQI